MIFLLVGQDFLDLCTVFFRSFQLLRHPQKAGILSLNFSRLLVHQSCRFDAKNRIAQAHSTQPINLLGLPDWVQRNVMSRLERTTNNQNHQNQWNQHYYTTTHRNAPDSTKINCNPWEPNGPNRKQATIDWKNQQDLTKNRPKIKWTFKWADKATDRQRKEELTEIIDWRTGRK